MGYTTAWDNYPQGPDSPGNHPGPPSDMQPVPNPDNNMSEDNSMLVGRVEIKQKAIYLTVWFSFDSRFDKKFN